MQSTRKRRLLGGGIALMVLVVTGLAYAAWTANGTGSGYAKAGSAQALTTSDVSGTTTSSLYPGTNGNVKIQINNPNPYPVSVTSVTGNGAITDDTVGCVTTGVTFTDQTGLDLDVPASSNQTFTLNNAASMSNASDNGCQGAVFTIPVSLSGASG